MKRLILGAAMSVILAACGSTPDSELPAAPAGPGGERLTPPYDDLTDNEELRAIDENFERKEVDAYYTDDWKVGYGWPGEYPDGFTVMEEGVVLMGRDVPYLEAPADIACPLDYGATIHQWNGSRVDRDYLIFVSATKTLDLTISEDTIIEAESDDMDTPFIELPVTKGDTVTILRYFGEGFGLIELDGTEYVADIMQLDAITLPTNEEMTTHLWVKVKCHTDGNVYPWIFFDEAIATDGVERHEITGYGEAYDLPEAQD